LDGSIDLETFRNNNADNFPQEKTDSIGAGKEHTNHVGKIASAPVLPAGAPDGYYPCSACAHRKVQPPRERKATIVVVVVVPAAKSSSLPSFLLLVVVFFRRGTTNNPPPQFYAVVVTGTTLMTTTHHPQRKRKRYSATTNAREGICTGLTRTTLMMMMTTMTDQTSATGFSSNQKIEK
jgi:hypothetical protein